MASRIPRGFDRSFGFGVCNDLAGESLTESEPRIPVMKLEKGTSPGYDGSSQISGQRPTETGKTAYHRWLFILGIDLTLNDQLKRRGSLYCEFMAWVPRGVGLNRGVPARIPLPFGQILSGHCPILRQAKANIIPDTRNYILEFVTL
jgi:hypothetical protein